ncbi:unnamed protein product [Allacma fusca]|uniref:CWF19-like protein 2 n=1 Tax=Allacma fusca TaxID=39272 RepID=A0A8J2LCM1_9HEXA|nr:unnamed protein product [Allacma fusca]
MSDRFYDCSIKLPIDSRQFTRKYEVGYRIEFKVKMSSDEDLTSASDSSEDGQSRRRSKTKSKSSKHRKHSKSHKKDKKKKKSHKRRKTPSDSSESASSDEWVTKEDLEKPKIPIGEAKVVKNQSIVTSDTVTGDRDEWMNFNEMIPTYSNDSKRSQRQAEKDAKRGKSSIEQLGQHDRELNPYWKDGGTGLPSEEVESNTNASKSTSSAMIGDGGLNWLRKAFLRAKEQAQEEGRSLEEIAEERWGSLQKFYEMLEQAESKAKQSNSSSSTSRRDSSHHSGRTRREKFQKPRYHSDSESGDERRSRKYSRHSDIRKSSSSQKYCDENHPRNSGWRKQNPEKESQISDKEEQKLQNQREPTPVQELQLSTANTSEECTDVTEEVKVLSDKEMNELSARILKAEMLGNEELVQTLKDKKESAEKARKDYVKTSDIKPTKTIIKVVLEKEDKGAGPRRKIRDKPGETHKDGQRVRYFPDDDRQTLKNMFEKEKRNTVENENALFSRLAGKRVKATEEYDMDDVFADRASSSKTDMKEKERELRDILDEDKQYKKTLENCNWCFDGNKLPRNLVISTGEKSFLCLPPYQSITEGHCLIVPMYHVPSATQLDEDVWEEMQKFRRSIVTMFSDINQDVVIFESAMFLKKHPHMYLECVPMPKETGELAPIYFKKAIQECETEWSQNKKLVDLRKRDVRKAVPKGLPYFAVDFGMDSGFAHVVEDERNFPRNFAQEIIGGMLELDHHLWRKQKQDDFKAQRDKVMAFLKFWGPYDWTRKSDDDVE